MSATPHLRRSSAAALVAAALIAAGPGGAHAQGQTSPLPPPTHGFVQFGRAHETSAVSLGLLWDTSLHRFLSASGALSSRFEVAIGRWRADSRVGGGHALVTQVGLTPVFRYAFGNDATWFVEAGIGVNVITPLYRTGSKQFSTAFNFGDHLGVGWRPRRDSPWDIALRIQHFSNAGIERPNPGEDFVQLRLTAPL
jgi:hypothetical protein